MIETIVQGAFWLAALLILAAIAITSVRLAKGPSLPDRVVALDLIALLLICFCGVFAGLSGEPAYLDIAVALALVAFLGTVAFARYAERRAAIVERDRAPAVRDGETDPVADRPAAMPADTGGLP